MDQKRFLGAQTRLFLFVTIKMLLLFYSLFSLPPSWPLIPFLGRPSLCLSHLVSRIFWLKKIDRKMLTKRLAPLDVERTLRIAYATHTILSLALSLSLSFALSFCSIRIDQFVVSADLSHALFHSAFLSFSLLVPIRL